MMEKDGIPHGSFPSVGSVLGVDVGFSATTRSSAACRLDWTEHHVTWRIQRFRARHDEQEATIMAVADGAPIECAAFDGPLRSGFTVIGRYRAAERMLTRRLQSIGKPGQASAPVGKKLNAAANVCATIVLEKCRLAPSTHAIQIDQKAIVEAFPTAFLGLMVRDPASVATRRNDRSDVFFEHLTSSGALQLLVTHLLPGRNLAGHLQDVINHDDRAALVCALTALSVAAGDFTAVGDDDGWIILPPRRFLRSWARATLTANAADEQPGCLHHTQPGLVGKHAPIDVQANPG